MSDLAADTLVQTGPVAAPAAAPVFRPSSTRLDWPRALRAWKALRADKEDTRQVFEIMRALNGRSAARGYDRLLTSAQGGRIAFQQQELMRLLDDDAAMAAYPAGTVGADYFAWRTAEGLSAEGLAAESRKGLDLSKVEEQHPVAWFGRRTRDVHDLWHILAGYGRDSLGEASLVAFSYAQTGGLGWALIAVGAGLSARRAGGDRRHVRAIWEGFRRGRRAAWLLGEDYERVLAEPVADARRRLNIGPAPAYEAVPPGLRDRTLG